MAPEQILGEVVDHRADLWSLGIVLYEGLAGRPPTAAENVGKVLPNVLTGSIRPLRECVPHLPDDVLDLADRMLAAEPAGRPSDLREVVAVLARYATADVPTFGPPRGPAASASPASARPASARTPDAAPPVAETALSPPAPAPVRHHSSRSHRRPFAHVIPIGLAVVVLAAGGVASAWRWHRASPDAPRAIATSPECPPGMRFVRGGTFTMGADDGTDTERPAHEVAVASFCLDAVEVTVQAYRDCAASGRCRTPETTVRWVGIGREAAIRESAECQAYQKEGALHPMNCVSWTDADAYCRARSRRLPTEEEWELAAAGGEEQRRFPWGAAAPGPRLLNVCDGRCAAAGAVGPGERPPTPMFDGDDGAAGPTQIGSYPAGDSRDGVADLAGNVWEWTASAYCPYDAPGCDAKARVFRGGGFEMSLAASARVTARLWSSPEHRYADVGFRCAAEPAGAR
jgi:formylglycine-generating enzyme required for sulfatase activity